MTRSGVGVSTATDTAGILRPTFNAERTRREMAAQVQITQTFSQKAPQAVARLSDHLVKSAAEQSLQARQYLALWREREAGTLTDPALHDELVRLEQGANMSPERAIATLEDPALRERQELFAEGGAGRIALHTLTGAIGGGLGGALGAGSVAAAAPQIDEWQRNVVAAARNVTSDLGIDGGYATMFGQAFGQVTSASLGAVAGGAAGAGWGFAVDTNNRQLHSSEVQRVRELAQGDKEKELRLLAAACAMTRCADGVPTDDPHYDFLSKLQAVGASMASEQSLLNQQYGRKGRVIERLFQYSWVDDYLIDPSTKAKLGTRTAGAGQFVLGGLGTLASGSVCVTGWGCAAGLIGGTVSLDYAQSGLTQAWTGQGSVPYGEQLLRSAGLSDEVAALGYGLLGLAAPAAQGASALGRTAGQGTLVGSQGLAPSSGARLLTDDGGATIARSGSSHASGRQFGTVEVGAGNAASMLSRIEGRFANASREVGFVVDSESGAILAMARQPYGQARASFRFSDEQWATAEGNWITHNHPSGNTFGIEDLAGAVASGARGIRASTNSGVYELAFDGSFASAYRGEKLGAVGFLGAETNKIGTGIIADVRAGTLIVPSGLTGSARNGFLANEMWTRYANQTPGLQYTFNPW
ncbi:hypothetical protein [Rhizobacter sp. LjRoot28]|uniref:hypothetical protein n=1 Tax=Rhizobacter sp. LjRoot28 TaxID=3342309 RepID=UPI003ED07C92